MSKSKAIFLDRDGTLNLPVIREGKPYPPASVEEFQLYDGVVEDCERLKVAGYRLVIVTNQPDVGRGTQSRAAVEAIHARLVEQVPSLDVVKVCFHGGEAHGQPCGCRKPAPGMILEAAAELGLDLSGSWMVGDRWGDIDAGHAAGCRTILISRGYSERAPSEPPEFTVESFAQAAGIILART